MTYGLKETYKVYQTNGIYVDLFGSWFEEYEYSSLCLEMLGIFQNKSLQKLCLWE